MSGFLLTIAKKGKCKVWSGPSETVVSSLGRDFREVWVRAYRVKGLM